MGAAPGPQEPPAPAKEQMFSGTVTAANETSLTVNRTGSKDSRTFSITPETKFEGPPLKVSARVTVRFLAAEGGDRAVRVIVRGPTAPPKK
jgi:hypothetical protein